MAKATGITKYPQRCMAPAGITTDKYNDIAPGQQIAQRHHSRRKPRLFKK